MSAIQYRTFIELSITQYDRSDRISSCKIMKGDDECWRVHWTTDDGDMTSEAFTSKKKAKEYIDEVIDMIPPSVLEE